MLSPWRNLPRASSPSATGRTCSEEDVRALDQRVAASLDDDVRYLGSVLIREDEVVLCHFEGTADAIRRVAERARVPYERLLATTVSVEAVRGKDAGMKGKLIRPALVALAVAGALLAVGGIAYATIPDSGGVIHGCYKNEPGHAARDRHRQGADVLELRDPAQLEPDRAAGVQGSKGPRAAGPPGPQGPTGPSDVWSVDGYGSRNKNLADRIRGVTLATTPTLPAGSYSVQAEAEARQHTVDSTPTTSATSWTPETTRTANSRAHQPGLGDHPAAGRRSRSRARTRSRSSASPEPGALGGLQLAARRDRRSGRCTDDVHTGRQPNLREGAQMIDVQPLRRRLPALWIAAVLALACCGTALAATSAHHPPKPKSKLAGKWTGQLQRRRLGSLHDSLEAERLAPARAPSRSRIRAGRTESAAACTRGRSSSARSASAPSTRARSAGRRCPARGRAPRAAAAGAPTSPPDGSTGGRLLAGFPTSAASGAAELPVDPAVRLFRLDVACERNLGREEGARPGGYLPFPQRQRWVAPLRQAGSRRRALLRMMWASPIGSPSLRAREGVRLRFSQVPPLRG